MLWNPWRSKGWSTCPALVMSSLVTTKVMPRPWKGASCSTDHTDHSREFRRMRKTHLVFFWVLRAVLLPKHSTNVCKFSMELCPGYITDLTMGWKGGEVKPLFTSQHVPEPGMCQKKGRGPELRWLEALAALHWLALERHGSRRARSNMWESTACGGFICAASLANNCTRLQYLVFQ